MPLMERFPKRDDIVMQYNDRIVNILLLWKKLRKSELIMILLIEFAHKLSKIAFGS